jgi:hypothetical protein
MLHITQVNVSSSNREQDTKMCNLINSPSFPIIYILCSYIPVCVTIFYVTLYLTHKMDGTRDKQD